jgi:hypothetical protein
MTLRQNIFTVAQNHFFGVAKAARVCDKTIFLIGYVKGLTLIKKEETIQLQGLLLLLNSTTRTRYRLTILTLHLNVIVRRYNG